MGSNKLAIRHAFPRACALCTVKIQPGADEHLHMQQHHTDESVTKGEILWLTPHEAVYAGRHYRPEDQSRPERRFGVVR